MSDRPLDLDSLRRVFTRPPGAAGAAPGCPPAERLTVAASGELSPDDLGPVLDHVAACAACTVAWGLVREGVSPPARTTASTGRSGLLRFLAVAAVIVLGVGIVLIWRGETPLRPETRPVFRTVDTRTIESLVPDQSVLSRDDFLLRWSAGEDTDGWLYSLRVTDERLEPVSRASALTDSAYRIPAEDLAAIPPGARLLWQVEATLPDGSRLTSPTFVVRIP